LVLTGAVSETEKIRSVLNRVEGEDVTTSWGIRTLSSLDPKYHPSLYHDGAVWPLVTGWAAISEIMSSRTEKAVQYLSSMADRILSENGMFAETYRGDRPEPFNSCILQAWSVAMYVYAFRELMVGSKMNMIDNKVEINPQIPESLRSSSMEITFEQYFHTQNGKKKIKIGIQPDRQRIVVNRIEGSGTMPDFLSGSYSVSTE
jgi:glycogen debranching enzyme